MEGGKIVFDELLSGYLGDFGWYQKRVYLLVCLPAIFCSVNSFTWTFAGSDIPHRCKLTPWDKDYFHPPFNASGGLLGSEGSCARLAGNGTGEVEPCLDGYVWDNSLRAPSALQDWELVCERNWIKAIIQSVYYAGIFCGSLVAGYLSDRCGRKPILMVSCTFLALIACLSTLCKGPWTYLGTRFAQGFLEPGVWQIGFIIGVELVGPSKRLLAGLVIEYAFSLGIMVLGLVAWAFNGRWQYLQLLVSAPGFLFLVYHWVMPESPRWLLANGRREEAFRVLRHAGRVNGAPVPEDVLHSIVGEEEESTTDPSVSYLSLVRTPNLRKHTLIICYQWAIVTLVYYGISLNPSALAGDFYVSFVLSAAVEFIAITILVFTLNRLGRRPIQAGSFFLSGAALIAILVVPKGWPILSLSLVLLAKLSVVGAFCTIYLYTSEIFPTVVRSIAIGLASTCARVGGIASPFASLFMNEDENKMLLLGAFGTSSLLAAVMTLLLPETNNRCLPETLEDGEQFGSDLLMCAGGEREKKRLGKGGPSTTPLVPMETLLPS